MRAYSSFSGSRPQIDQRADRSMINMDDPTHQQQRKLVSRRFNPGGVRGQEDHVRELVTEILDPVVPLGECEVVEAIASRLPAMMIGDLLGYPRDMWELLRHWSERTMTLGGLNMTDGPPYVSHPEVIPVMAGLLRADRGAGRGRAGAIRATTSSRSGSRQGWETGARPRGDAAAARRRRRDDPHRHRLDDPRARAPARPAPAARRAARAARRPPRSRSSSAG